MKKVSFLLKIGFIALCFFTFKTANAEIINPENNLSLITEPASPAPETQVTARVESFLFDLNRSKISWQVNGTTKKSAIGGVDFSFQLGKAGSVTNVKAIVDTPDGTRIEKELSIRPAGVDIAWEARSTTPPFYKGKALFPPEGDATLVALPALRDGSGNLIPESSLIYRWTVDREVQGSASGYGKNTYSFQGSVLSNPVSVKVEVARPRNARSAI